MSSQNVIADLAGSGDDVVVVGAHYDTVSNTVGANDNGSGMAVVLLLAKELASSSPESTIRFIFFGSEETGLHGSNHYVNSLSKTERGKIKAMLNLDVVGTGSHMTISGEINLQNLALQVAARDALNVKVQHLRRGTSDHSSFSNAGIPAMLIYAPDIRYIHKPSDTLQHVRAELLGVAFLTAKGMLESLAK